MADIILELETGGIIRSMCICCDSDIYEFQVKRIWECWLFQWMLVLSSLSRSIFSGFGTPLSNFEVLKLWYLIEIKIYIKMIWVFVHVGEIFNLKSLKVDNYIEFVIQIHTINIYFSWYYNDFEISIPVCVEAIVV